MSARDDYPLALAGVASGQWQAMCNELDRLRQWKAEAMQVLAEWERVWEAAGRPGPLGSSKAAAVAEAIRDLPAKTANAPAVD